MLRTVPLLLLLICSLALAACGGGGGSSSTSRGSDEEKRLAFEDCLRDEGLDVQTSPDGRTAIRMTATAGGKGSGATGQRFGAPNDPDGPFARCREKTGWAPSPPTAAQQARMRDQGLRVARCMREHGVDMPDPSPGGGMLMRVDPDSPTFQAAARACGLGTAGKAGGGVLAGPR